MLSVQLQIQNLLLRGGGLPPQALSARVGAEVRKVGMETAGKRLSEDVGGL